MLTQFIPQLPHILLPRSAWQPYPTLNDRPAWEKLPGEVKNILCQRGETRLNFAWPSLPATLFLEYARIGNRAHYEAPHFERRGALAELALAECVENQGRFLDDIANGIWALCEETYWGVPAHVNAQKAGVDLPDVEEPTVDLFAAETAALLAWTDYLLGDRLDAVSPLLRPRIRYEVQRRLLEPCRVRDDFWWMSFQHAGHGINNWNPWVNSNWLTCALLLESDETRRREAVSKILRSLDLFIDTYGEAGGCDEGPGYWGRAAASLFDCLDLLYRATNGSLTVYDQVKIQNMGRFIYRAHIGGDYYVNFADASAVNQPPGSLVFRYGQRIADPAMQAFGAYLSQQAGPAAWTRHEGLLRQLPALSVLPEMGAASPAQPLPEAFWFDDIQALVAREREGSLQGLFLAAKGGHNAESHNHNDVGSFLIYANGLPAIVDAGVETYTRKTFSPQRYEIWTMQSAYHSLLPTFATPAGEVQQLPGREFAARQVNCTLDADHASLSLDLAGAYPPQSGLERWQRVIRLQRGQSVQVRDHFTFTTPPQAVAFSLLTPSQPQVVSPSALELTPVNFHLARQSAGLRIAYPPEFAVHFERVPISDERMGSVWGNGLNRIVFSLSNPPARGEWVWEFRA